jgi:hypothetical protein
VIIVFFFFAETRGSVLLSRKAKALNKYYTALEDAGYPGVMMPSSASTSDPQKKVAQRIRWKVLADEERSSIVTMLRISLLRPFTMLVTEPVVFFFSLWVSFSWGVLYMTFAAVPLIFERTYGFNIEQVGGVFASTCVASILFAVVAICQERLGRRYLPASQTAILDSPEGRLYFACVESALLPIGCLWFCIAGAYPSVHWIVPTIGLGCSTMVCSSNPSTVQTPWLTTETGHLQHLPRCLQLPRRRLPPLRQQCSSRAIFLPQYAGWRVSFVRASYASHPRFAY